MHILLIEDDQKIINGLKFSFLENNYHLTYCKTIKESLMYLNHNHPDLIILDVSLPDGNGFNFFIDNIQKADIPTIFLTAKDDENDIIKGLDIGADDYLTKPFSTKELLTRVKKILMRFKKENLIKISNITFDLTNMQVFIGQEEIFFTALETRILQLLLLNLNHIVTRDTILDTIWEITGNDVDDHTITVYLKRIKDKLGTNIITTIKGIGYKINAN